MTQKIVIAPLPPETIETKSGTPILKQNTFYDTTLTQNSNFNASFKLITTSPINAKVINQLESGAPYLQKGTSDDIQHTNLISTSITEHLNDKIAAPNFIFPFESQQLPDPFPDGMNQS